MNSTGIAMTAGRSTCHYDTDNLTEKVFKCIAYFAILIVSLVGNILVICVVFMNRRMRTVTNYLIVNMAVADLLLTVFNMPPTIKTIITENFYWFGGIHGDILCKVVPFVQALSVASSVLTLTAIALDRFFAIMYPLKRYVTFTVAYRMMAGVWIVGIGVNAPILYAQRNVLLGEETFQPGEFQCKEIWVPAFSERASQDFTVVLFVVFYALPLLAMSVLYSFIIYRLWVRKVPGNQTFDNQQRADKTKKKVLKMLLTVVVIFALCWLPVYISQFIIFFAYETHPCGPPALLMFFGYFLGHANSAINPCIYAIFNENFRKGFRDVVLCRCRRRRVAPAVQGSVIDADKSYVGANPAQRTSKAPKANSRSPRASCPPPPGEGAILQDTYN